MKGSGSKYDYLKRQLSVSHMLAFKIWNLSTSLKVAKWFLAIVASIVAVFSCFYWASATLVGAITLGRIGVLVASSIAVSISTYVIGKKLMRIIRLRETLTLIAIAIGLASFGWFAARIHLWIFDWWFLSGGSLATFRKK